MESELTPEFVEIFTEEALDLLSQWEEACNHFNPDDEKSFLDKIFRFAHNLKGSSRAVGMIQFGETVHLMEDYIVKVKEGKIPCELTVVSNLFKFYADLNGWINNQRNNLNEEVSFNPLSLNLINDENTNKKNTPVKNKEIPKTKKEFNDVAKEKEDSLSAKEFIRVDCERIEEVIKILGELSIQHSQIEHMIFNENSVQKMESIKNKVKQSSKLIKEVQEISISLRMMSVCGLFKKLRNICLSLANQLDKEIEVDIKGEDVDLDKVVIQKISDPLVHIVRNAIDHGIETKEDRIKKNKSKMAKIEILAVQEADKIRLTICDDGKGLDPEFIYKKAIDKGLISKGKKLTRNQILNLIFLPGFSTASQVTDISGRGVGMDVVKNSIEALKGKIGIASKVHVGTKFEIVLPTSLSIINSLIVNVNNNKIVIPTLQIQELIDLRDYELIETKNKGKILRFRNKLIPVEFLRSFIKLDHHESNNLNESSHYAIIFNSIRQSLAFRIDSIESQQLVVVKDLNEKFKNIKHLMGGTILKNGDPCLILDLNSVCNEYNFRCKVMSAKGEASNVAS